MPALSVAKIGAASVLLIVAWWRYWRFPYVERCTMPDTWKQWALDVALFPAVIVTTMMCLVIILQKGSHGVLLWPFNVALVGLFTVGWMISLAIYYFPARTYSTSRNALREYAEVHQLAYSERAPSSLRAELKSELAPKPIVGSADSLLLTFATITYRNSEGASLTPALVCQLPTVAAPNPSGGAKALRGEPPQSDVDPWYRVHQALSESELRFVKRRVLLARALGGRFTLHLGLFPEDADAVTDLVRHCERLRAMLESTTRQLNQEEQ